MGSASYDPFNVSSLVLIQWPPAVYLLANGLQANAPAETPRDQLAGNREKLPWPSRSLRSGVSASARSRRRGLSRHPEAGLVPVDRPLARHCGKISFDCDCVDKVGYVEGEELSGLRGSSSCHTHYTPARDRSTGIRGGAHRTTRIIHSPPLPPPREPRGKQPASSMCSSTPVSF
jgi:hypothetical protein